MTHFTYNKNIQTNHQAQQYGEEAERVYGDLKRRHGAYRNTQQRLNQLTEGR
jgi:hypothetical protein